MVFSVCTVSSECEALLITLMAYSVGTVPSRAQLITLMAYGVSTVHSRAPLITGSVQQHNKSITVTKHINQNKSSVWHTNHWPKLGVLSHRIWSGLLKFTLSTAAWKGDTRRDRFHPHYRLGTLNSNTVNSKFHLIRSFFEIFARFLSFHV